MRALAAFVPTLAASPGLTTVLESLRQEGGTDLELVLVWSGGRALPKAARALADRVEESGPRLGFAAAANRGIAASERPWVALVNDDAPVEAGWLACLFEAANDDPRVAALQGTNLYATEPERVDGLGIGWNRHLQAVQVGRGGPPPAPSERSRAVFGVSATACLLRRQALVEVSLDGGRLFDEQLDSYYEDVELAGRLRAHGWDARTVPAARARHAGGTSATALGSKRLALLYANRHLVLARLLGPEFDRVAPRLRRRDLRDLLVHPPRAAGILGGWVRARRLMTYYRSEVALSTLEELATFPAP